MKTLKVVIIAMALVLAGTLKAQVAVNINVGTPPMWGPAGYSGVQYYYLPDVYSYYDVRSSMFIYQSRGKWIHRSYLPTRYRNYDLYRGYKVVMTDYHGDTPYTHFKSHKIKYAKGYRGPAQKNIGAKPGKGNSVAKQNARNYSKEKVNQGGGKNNNKTKNDNGKGNGHGKKK